ncbi:MAG: tryptophan--tRNA ligase [Anaerorhabdus sp.]|uniref:tryptophan--tRNA ligase n=1 Tax=Anaerorhabdus sp. TaxID=1872524 RepID=UPI002FC92992
MKKMLSGIKPSGQLTLGNYIGALRNFVKYQDEYEMIVFIANLHCITVPQDPTELKKNLKDAIALYLACGLDPERSTIFLQSDVMEHAQLGFIMCCSTYMGELNRMTQFKDKQVKGETNLTGGLYTYPALMAADILIYDPDFVPVGEDQKQHVELTRDLALRFNNRYNTELFKVPEPIVPKVGARIMSLSEPTKKMSKSDKGDKGCIHLLDDLNVARKKVMSAVTDNFGKVNYDPANQPGVSNLLEIMSSLTGISIDELVKQFENSGYGDFKKAVADVVVSELEKIQTKYNEIMKSGEIEKVLEDGANKARLMAHKKLVKVQKKIGIEIR